MPPGFIRFAIGSVSYSFGATALSDFNFCIYLNIL